ncbi:hypothetical protein [Neokomagataea anthophila]|uniref:DUF4403 family protein n=1 Tax=Neokomagataea anthophila TaxID=2826925 RepID=A0ABS5E4S1_9PROT|nr:hypothetical protein [Neokomagataea anthophila]MBR0558894.1 hypothetical protein [Neokomagataea anthophila]
MWKFFFKKQITLSIPKLALQKSLNLALPLTTEAAGFEISIPKVDLSFMSDDRMRVTTTLNVQQGIFHAQAELQFSATLIFREKKFYISDLLIEKTTIGKITTSNTNEKESADNSWENALRSVVKTLNLEEKTASLINTFRPTFEKFLTGTGGKIISALLEHIPVYSLTDDTRINRMMGASLISIKMAKEKVKVTLGRRS